MKQEDFKMVTIGLKIKNASRAMKPKKGDVIIFDGKEWYITTKEDIFKEYEEKVDKKLAEVSQKLIEIAKFKQEVSENMVTMSETIKDFVKFQSEGDK